MSTSHEPGFFARWSLRKRQAGEVAREASGRPAEAEPPAPEDPELPPDEPTAPAPPADLPDIAELGADSDYRGFLDRAVPKELRVAALRKAWVSDPAIAGYRPLADYDWDFNAPGYAALRPTDDPTKFVTALFRHLTDGRSVAEVADQPPEHDRAAPGDQRDERHGDGKPTVATKGPHGDGVDHPESHEADLGPEQPAGDILAGAHGEQQRARDDGDRQPSGGDVDGRPADRVRVHAAPEAEHAQVEHQDGAEQSRHPEEMTRVEERVGEARNPQ